MTTLRKHFITAHIFISVLLFISIPFGNENFIKDQKRYPRVRRAFQEKEQLIQEQFQRSGLNFPPKEIFIRIFKLDRIVELWARDAGIDIFSIVQTYAICAQSGSLGPKRKRGDLQVPEGFYFINDFNPYSQFYLSLRVNYPNESDKILGKKEDLGGDIFIHGDCVTIGCVPITNEKIKELYLVCVSVKSGGQDKIPVHIFPTKLDSASFTFLEQEFGKNLPLINYWKNLKKGFDFFEHSHQLPIVEVDKSTGDYKFKASH